MIATLSLVSRLGIWMLTDADGFKVLASVTWDDTESADLAGGIGAHFGRLLSNHSLDDLTALACVSGPGAFTGLRSSASFAQGLARARSLPLFAIPTYDLLGETFFVPLRHQKAAVLNLTGSLAAGLEFLRLEGPEEEVIARPETEGARVVGLVDEPLWPSSDMLFRGLRKNLATGNRLTNIRYGLEPKISGVRT